MNQDQVDSLVRSFAKMVGGVLAAHGATAMASTINSSDVIQLVSGITMAIVAFWASHKSNAAIISTPPITIVKTA